MISVNLRPTAKQLRQFAGIWFPLFCAVLGFLLIRSAGLRPAYIVWTCGIVLGLIGMAWPPAIRPVFVGLMVITYPIGWVVSHVVLAIAYYLILTPVGLALRALGKDPLDKGKIRRNTYWQPRKPPESVTRYFRQY